MKVIEYRLNRGTLFLESLLKIGVYVTGNRLDLIHPFLTEMLDEVINDLPFLV